MSRYIDADKLKEKKVYSAERRENVVPVAEIDWQPTADAVEVRHGEWRSELQKRCDWRGKQQQYYCPNACSVCHEAVADRTPYCPNCGAKMDGERREK